MDKNAIRKYAVWARNELIARVTQKAEQFEITEQKTTPADADGIGGRVLTATEKKQRQALIAKINHDGFGQVMEEVAYTWFNRFTALRFMEVNNYLPSHTRVFTNESGEFKPQILTDAIQLDLDGLDMDKVYELKEANRTEELYKYLLITQCNALSAILPRMFQKIADYTELLLPDYLLREGSVIEQMISMIPEDSFDVNSGGGQIEIIGWLYQYYISEKHEEVVDPLHGKIVKKEEIPAATQLFTTDWVVRYLIDNSVGRYWIERNPKSNLADKLTYYVSPKSGVTEYVNEKITPQDVTTFDPCVGSGHFLIYAFDVLMKIYEEYGYSEREAAAEIVKNNLFGLDIDGRASQLAYFSIMMKARQYDRRFFSRNIQPHIYEINESNGVDKLGVDYFCGEDAVLKKDINSLLDAMKDAKEYGSILEMPSVDFGRIHNRFEKINDEINMYSSYLLSDFQMLIHSAEVMSGKYAIVATNPPYLNKYDPKLKEYINAKYRDYSGDLFSVFIYRNFGYCKKSGYSGFMTPFVWLSIKSYAKLREYVLRNKHIVTLIQFEYSAYEEATVPICTFVLQNSKTNSNGLYFDLSDFVGGMEVQRRKMEQALSDRNCGYYYESNQNNFERVPTAPITAYRVSDAFLETFNAKKLDSYASANNGFTTGDNNKFLRLWFEVDLNKIDFSNPTLETLSNNPAKWFPYNKGGDYRKWYGNNDYVINWGNEGADIKAYGHLVPRSMKYQFRESVTWNKITSGTTAFRYKATGTMFDVGGLSMFPQKTDDLYYLLALCNSVYTKKLLGIISPTLNCETGHVSSIPVIMCDQKDEISKIAKENVALVKADWDSFETSSDFSCHPLVRGCSTISEAFSIWKQECDSRFENLKKNEEILNAHFLEIYNLKEELNAEVEDEFVSIRKADRKRDIKSLISYAVGCMFGRYSLDYPGIAYAGGDWDSSKYSKCIPDKDAIIPICDDEYFEDDIVGKFIKFIEIVYGKTELEENLRFVAESLGGKGTSREVIRNYFINDFFADHCSMYSVTGSGKRPIYWLFDSGKKNGFKCLIYIHRYHEDTVARIRTDYIHEQQSRYRTAIADLEQRISGATTSDRVNLNRQLSIIRDQADEIRQYEEKIHHLADQMISIDLDDGVKSNYEIFKDVLAKIK